MSHGYAIIGKAGRSTGFIPSLIGVLPTQEVPSQEDVYFARFDIEDYEIGSVTEIGSSRWVNYDSLPLDRDPILTVKGRHGSYYIPRSELLEIAQETSDSALLALLNPQDSASQ